MRILLSWLHDFVDVPVGAVELADLLTMRGFELAAIEPTGDDPADAVIDLEITANRPDCQSVLGIAREVATAFQLPLRMPGPTAEAALATRPLFCVETAAVEVTIEDPQLCPRYAAAVAEVTVGPSPAWLARRLQAADVRPINNVVDASNYVLLETGHPTHAFDLDRVAERRLHIRRARMDERLVTLDGHARELTDDMLVIADAQRPQALAGIMGGADTEVQATTRIVALESAYFTPLSVRRTSKQLGLKTEASTRFERGADIGAPIGALERLCALLEHIEAGTAHGDALDRYPAPRPGVRLRLRHARVTRLLGQTVSADALVRILEGLGFGITSDGDEGCQSWQVDVPTARVDVTREVDLIEEVGRHHGYDTLPITFPRLTEPPPPPDPRIARDALVRRVVTAAGFSEAMTFTFISQAAAERFSAAADLVPVANPLSETFAVMRPSLGPGLLDAIAHNRRREQPDVRVFEVGTRFSVEQGETRCLGLAWSGAAAPAHWSQRQRPVDFYDLKGVVDTLGDALGVEIGWRAETRQTLVEGGAAVLTSLGEPADVTLGWAGQVRPSIARAHGLETGDEVFLVEVDLDALTRIAHPRDERLVQPLPRHPSIVRDLSLVVDGRLPAATVRDTIRGAAPSTLVGVAEFDRYQGKGVPEGRVSISVRLTFRAPDRTLTDPEVQRAVGDVVAALEREHGAALRR